MEADVLTWVEDLKNELEEAGSDATKNTAAVTKYTADDQMAKFRSSHAEGVKHQLRELR